VAKNNKTSRRNCLKSVGASAAGISVLSGIGTAKTNPKRTIRLDTSGHEQLSEAKIVFESIDNIKIYASGTRKKGAPGKTYTFEVRDFKNGSQELTPGESRAKIVQSENTPVGKPEATTKSGNSTEKSGSSTSDVSTQSHVGDYEGGIGWVTRDPVNLATCRTRNYAKWSQSGGEVDSMQRYYTWTTWDYKETTWEKDSVYFDGGIDYNDSSEPDGAYSEGWGHYDNWNWQDDDQITEAEHFLQIWGLPNGDMKHQGMANESGEDSNILHADFQTLANY